MTARTELAVEIRPTGRRISDADTHGVAPEIEVWVRAGATGATSTGDGTRALLEGDRLVVTGPPRDVLVIADGRPLQRRRGDDLRFDLSSVVERRAAGAFDPAALQAAERADAMTGVRHRYELEPQAPQGGDRVAVVVRSDSPILDGSVRWSATSSTGESAGASHLQPAPDGTTAAADLPGFPEGTTVRYEVTATTSAGDVAVADAGVDYGFHRPGLALHRSPCTTFSYRVGAPPPPAWWRDAVVYHLLLDRFAGSAGEPVDESAISLLAFAGGTIAGATARLDHVAALGATAVLVSPWHAGDMHVCYDVVDFTAVDPRLGTLDDVRAFLRRAHDLGLKVVLDVEMSYLGAGHPMAEAVLDGPAPETEPWVVVHEGRPLGWYGGNPTFRPVDHANPAARQHLLDAAKFWLDVGVDGFRLDSAHAASFDFWTDFGATVHAANPQAVTIAEATRDRVFCNRFEGRLTGHLDFELERALRGFAAGNLAPSEVEAAAAVADGTPDGLARATFVECHDDDRLSHVVGGDLTRNRLGHLLLLALPGTPILYYGTEVGLAQPAAGDPDLMVRLPMPWASIDDDQLAWTRAAVALRRSLPALGPRGTRVPLLADDTCGVWAFARTTSGANPDEVVLVVANSSARAAQIELDLSLLGGPAHLDLTVPAATAVVAPAPTFAPVELP